MKRTVSLRLETTKEQEQLLSQLHEEFLAACNTISKIAQEEQCWNRVALHHHVYYRIRQNSALGSQMVCNAIFAVCKAYKAKAFTRTELQTSPPLIRFHRGRSIHVDKRTYSLKESTLSLYTLQGRIRVGLRKGPFQAGLMEGGLPKEGELICRKGRWYFNLVLEFPDVPRKESTKILAVDLGENVLAATSNGALYGGGAVQHARRKFLNKRRVLQANGTQSAKQLLKKISGKEARRIHHVNHTISKKIIQEAEACQAGMIVLEDLIYIRSRIKAGKKVRSRLHSWAFRQLQAMIHYKAEAHGLYVLYVNPAYSSQLCSLCGQLGARTGSVFTCSCGNQQHSDLNASRNLCGFARSIGCATCAVNRT